MCLGTHIAEIPSPHVTHYGNYFPCTSSLNLLFNVQALYIIHTLCLALYSLDSTTFFAGL